MVRTHEAYRNMLLEKYTYMTISMILCKFRPAARANDRNPKGLHREEDEAEIEKKKATDGEY